jgi:hypothetical protein
VRYAETGRLGRDELRHDHWFIASVTHPTTERLSTSRSSSNSALSWANRAFSARSRASSCVRTRSPHPETARSGAAGPASSCAGCRG